jgi:hypothetical protein
MLLGAGALAIAIAIAISLLVRCHRTPARVHSPSSHTPLLTTAERERLRAQIHAGNRRLADAAAARAAAVAHDAALPSPDPMDGATPGQADYAPAFPGDTAIMLEYRTRTFDIANAIIDECTAANTDGGSRIEVRYDIIADDDAGGLFEEITFPAATNNSGPDTMECLTSRLLGATLPAPPSDIDRFHFAVEIIVTIDDAGTRDSAF